MSDHSCHPLLGRRVEIVDVKRRDMMHLIGQTGTVRHDRDGFDLVRLDAGGWVDPIAEVIIEPAEPA